MEHDHPFQRRGILTSGQFRDGQRLQGNVEPRRTEQAPDCRPEQLDAWSDGPVGTRHCHDQRTALGARQRNLPADAVGESTTPECERGPDVDKARPRRLDAVDPATLIGHVAHQHACDVDSRTPQSAGDCHGDPAGRITVDRIRYRLQPTRRTLGEAEVTARDCRVEGILEQHFKRAIHAGRSRAKDSARESRAGRR